MTPWMGNKKMRIETYKVNLSGSPEDSARSMLQAFKQSLLNARGVDKHREELEWEIRLYDFMLEDPVARLDEYKKHRFVNGVAVKKRDIVKMLGWNVS